MIIMPNPRLLKIRELAEAENNHTPTPWVLENNNQIVGAAGKEIIQLEDDGACGDENCCGSPSYHTYLRCVDAELIVKAVNAYVRRKK